MKKQLLLTLLFIIPLLSLAQKHVITTSKGGSIKTSPDPHGINIYDLKPGDSIKIVDYLKGGYYRVQVPKSDAKSDIIYGYINEMWVNVDLKVTLFKNEVEIDNSNKSVEKAKTENNYLCENISKEYDEFEKTTTYYTPSSEKVSFTKVIQFGKPTYYLSLSTIGSTLNIGEYGVKIMFEDKSILSFPTTKVKVDIDDNGYEYSSFIRIQPALMLKLKSKRIKSFKLYIYNDTLDEEESHSAKRYFECLTIPSKVLAKK